MMAFSEYNIIAQKLNSNNATDVSWCPKVSVVMVNYNGEKYLADAVTSVVQQSYKDWELIIVDDGSTDGSVACIRRQFGNNTNIKLVELKENNGVAHARNIGLQHVQGEFLLFVDADDYIDIDYIEQFVRILSETNADCIKLGCWEEYYNKQNKVIGVKEVCLVDELLEDRKQIVLKVIDLEKLPLFGYLWNGLYKMEIIRKQQLAFDESLSVNEDFDFNIKYFKYVEKFYTSSYIGYHYMKRYKNSLTTNKLQNYYEHQIKKIYQLLDFYRSENLLSEDCKISIYWLYTRYIYSYICRNLNCINKNEFFNGIFSSQLFLEFKQLSFDGESIKIRILTNILKSENKHLLVGVAACMNLLNTYGKSLFAKIKE